MGDSRANFTSSFLGRDNHKREDGTKEDFWAPFLILGIVISLCVCIRFCDDQLRRWREQEIRHQRLVMYLRSLDQTQNSVRTNSTANSRDLNASRNRRSLKERNHILKSLIKKKVIDCTQYYDDDEALSLCPSLRTSTKFHPSEEKLWGMENGNAVANTFVKEDFCVLHGDTDKCCPICLSDFEVDDSICYSENPACHHFFHEVCIMEWLMRKGVTGNMRRCPCCRHIFLYRRKKKKSSNRRRSDDEDTIQAPGRTEENERQIG